MSSEAGPVACSPSPAFGAALQPRSAISRRGNIFEFGAAQPLRKTTSAACGAGRGSIANDAAEGCPVSAFIAPADESGILPDEESRTRHAPILRFGRP
ncbi:MAG: hypothetical protein DRJ65_15370 [Acidobacteria bacterium]|nr:MAG: hypothetical protein DRJ65_15370 [Acidobacteriota bacterium]